MTTPRLHRLLQRLVSVPSVNPELSEDPAIAGEARMAEMMVGLLEQAGFAVDTHEPIRGRPNVIGRFGPKAPRRTLLIESHLDTQGIQGMVVPPFDGEIRGGRLYGRGACDTKGPMAAAIDALEPALLRELADAGVEVVYVGAIGEEKGNVGAEQLLAMGIEADEALILEPTELAVVHAHKGTMWFEVETRGLAAHGSNPGMGVNAVRAMSEVMTHIERDVARAAAAHDHPVLGRPTVNFGILRGGSSINIVPDHCSLHVDRRTLPGEDSRAIVESVEGELHRLRREERITGGQVNIIKDSPPFETTVDSRLVRRLVRACRGHAEPGRTEGAAWYSDAGPFARSCREVAVFGPGSIRQAHTVDEYIDLASLDRGRAILASFLRDLAAEVAASA